MTRRCLLCKEPIPRGRGRAASPYCSVDCSNATAEARAVITNLIRNKVKQGELAPASDFECVDCGAPATDYEHREYLKPLMVVPTCRSCNLKRGPAIDIPEMVAEYLEIEVAMLPPVLIAFKTATDMWRSSHQGNSKKPHFPTLIEVAAPVVAALNYMGREEVTK